MSRISKTDSCGLNASFTSLEVNIYATHDIDSLHRISIIHFVLLVQQVIHFKISSECIVECISDLQTQFVDVVQLIIFCTKQASVSVGCQIVIQADCQLFNRLYCYVGIDLCLRAALYIRQIRIGCSTDPSIIVITFPAIINSFQLNVQEFLITVFQIGTGKEGFCVNARQYIRIVSEPAFVEDARRNKKGIRWTDLVSGKDVKPESGSCTALHTDLSVQPFACRSYFFGRIEIAVDEWLLKFWCHWLLKETFSSPAIL